MQETVSHEGSEPATSRSFFFICPIFALNLIFCQGALEIMAHKEQLHSDVTINIMMKMA